MYILPENTGDFNNREICATYIMSVPYDAPLQRYILDIE